MKEYPPTFWDGVITGVGICCAIVIIVTLVLAQIGVIDG